MGFGIEVVQAPLHTDGKSALPADLKDRIMGVLVQYPDMDGSLVDWAPLAKEVKQEGGLVWLQLTCLLSR